MTAAKGLKQSRFTLMERPRLIIHTELAVQKALSSGVIRVVEILRREHGNHVSARKCDNRERWKRMK
jgi:hypothetical protein